jgi:hypothetical protein
MVVVGASKVKGALPLRLPASEGNGTERKGAGGRRAGFARRNVRSLMCWSGFVCPMSSGSM